MVKQATSRKATKIVPQNKSKKSKNSILRDHNLDLLVHGKRKRIPTQRALEAQALLRPSKKIKKVAPKIKRMGTMQQTAKEGLVFLKRSKPTKKEKITIPVVKTSTKKVVKTKIETAKPTKNEKDRGRKGQSQTKTGKDKVNVSEPKGKSQSKSASKSVSKGPSNGKVIKRTKSIVETLKEAKVILAGNNHPEEKTKKKSILKRTKTMAETIKEAKAYLKSHNKKN